MSNNKDNKKKGFFSRLFGGSSAPEDIKSDDKSLQPASEIPSKSALTKMKKADIVDLAKEHGLELDMSLTKAQLLEAWELHFSSEEVPSQEETPAEEAPVEEEAPAEESPVEEEKSEEAPVEEKAPAEEETPAEEAPVEEEAPAEEAPTEETPAEEEKSEEAPVEEKAPAEEETPAEEAPVEEEAPAEEAPTEETPAEEAPADKEIKVSLDEKTPSQIISNFENQQMKTDVPEFRPGDTLVVSVKVREGERTRLQAFEGVVMGVKNSGLNSSFIVRKISSGIGVERTFQTHSPMIDSIKVKRKGDVRQAKLFYLRERSGKSARIKERLE